MNRREAMKRALREGRSHFEFQPETRRLILSNSLNIAIGIALVIAVWWVVAEAMISTRGALFPTPPETFSALWEALTGSEVNGETIYFHTWSSLLRWGAGYAIALLIGVLAGIAFGTLSRVYDMGMVSVYVIQMIPGLAWVPIAMLIFGLGESATVFIILMTAMPPIIINTAGGIRQVPPVYTRVARMSGKDRAALFTGILIPAASLSIIDGMRIGLANGWRVLIAAEMVLGAMVGLGATIYDSRYSLDFVSAFICIIVICFIGLAIEKLFFAGLENVVRNRLGLDKEG
ncbi:MAG: ABC transporter permease subunit [Methanomassiliicoccales archaeon]|nr:ABC transporter permease subunit [Methanomassiliicoccales archaeon]